MFTYNDHSVRMVTCCSSFKRKQSVTPLMIGTDRKKTMRMCVCVLFVFNTIVTLSSLYSVRNCVDRTQKECCCAGAINPSIKSVSFPSLTLAYMHTHTHTHHNQQLVILASSFFLSFVVIADGVERNQASTNDGISLLIRIIILCETSIM